MLRSLALHPFTTASSMRLSRRANAARNRKTARGTERDLEETKEKLKRREENLKRTSARGFIYPSP